MNRLIKLANEKNHYLEKFLTLNEEQCAKLKLGNYDNLDDFYQTREQILEIIRYLDAELTQIGNQIETSSATDDEKMQLKQAMLTKDEYVARILDQDIEVLSVIEKAKTEIIHDLRGIRKNKKAISGYKSKTDFSTALNEEC